MKETPHSVNFRQIHLSLAYQRPKSCFERISVVKRNSKAATTKYINKPSSAPGAGETSQGPKETRQSETTDKAGHACVNFGWIEPEESARKTTQKILVSSALRRPHATQYSQLDSQTLPEHGRLPRQPYRPKSASTLYSYAKRPVSASDAPNHLGRPTKASLLRSKSAAEVCPPSPPCPANTSPIKKKECAVRKEYLSHKNMLSPKEVLDYMTSVHSYLTGARYNCSRFVDSKSKHKLGLYISKEDRNAFIINKPKHGAKLVEDDVPDVGRKMLDKKSPNPNVSAVGINTEPHFLSVNKWHGAEWSNCQARKAIKPSKSDNRRPVSIHKGKPIRAQYINYNTLVHAV